MKNPTIKTLLLFLSLMALLSAGVFFIERNWTRIVTPAGQASEDGPDNLHPDLAAGLAALRANRLDEARNRLEKLQPTDPGYPLALINLTVACERLGDLEAALEAATELITVEPEDSKAWIRMSWVQYRLGRYREAEFSSVRALEVDPTNIPARYDAALFRVAQGRTPEAINAYTRAFKRDQFGHSYLFQAHDHLLELRSNRPDLPSVHYALAFFANSLGWREREIEELERSLSLESTGPAAEAARTNLAKARQGLRQAPGR